MERENVFSGAPGLQLDIIVRRPDGLTTPWLSAISAGSQTSQIAGTYTIPWRGLQRVPSLLQGGTTLGGRSNSTVAIAADRHLSTLSFTICNSLFGITWADDCCYRLILAAFRSRLRPRQAPMSSLSRY